MFSFSKYFYCNAQCDLNLPKCCNGVSCAMNHTASRSMTQLPLVTFFNACVEVVDCIEFEFVFHKMIRTKMSFNLGIHHKDKQWTQFCFVSKEVYYLWRLKASMKIEILCIGNIYLYIIRILHELFLVCPVDTTCPTRWHNLLHGWVSFCHFTYVFPQPTVISIAMLWIKKSHIMCPRLYIMQKWHNLPKPRLHLSLLWPVSILKKMNLSGLESNLGPVGSPLYYHWA